MNQPRMTSSDEAVPRSCQHTKPCHDCPFSRNAIRGWLGGASVEDWTNIVKSDSKEMCHTCGNQQCAGLAIMRANICFLPRDQSILRLPADRKLVFANTQEFSDHHAESAPKKRARKRTS